MKRASVVGLATAALALVVHVPLASGQFGLSGVSAAPTSPLAAAHSDFTVEFAIGEPARDLKDLKLHLPPGLVGNPNAADRCAVANLARCPASSRVGSITVDATTFVIGLPVSIVAPGDIYNLQPAAGEPARLGIRVVPLGGLLGDMQLVAPISLRPGDFGLDATLTAMPNSFAGFPLNIDAVSMTLFSHQPVSGAAFMSNPTSCGPAKTRIEATAYDGSQASASAGFTPADCAGVPFDPSIEVAPASQPADLPGEVAVSIVFPAAEEPRRQAHLSRAEVALPVGTALSPGVAANGLEACSDTAFRLGQKVPAACPQLSRIGDVTFDTPLIGVLGGDVYLGEPKHGQQLRLLIAVEDPRVRLKLVGLVRPDLASGQLTTTFEGLPQVPFTRFRLRFRGGDDAVLTAPPSCGTHTASAVLTAWSDPARSERPQASLATVDCPPPAFTPTLEASFPGGTPAGAPAKPTLRILRPDRQSRLSSMRLSFPPGLAGSLSGVAFCPTDDARAGNCGEDSRVGRVRVAAGTGAAPAVLDGTLHLTTGVGGAPAGLALIVPVRVGPLDLGNVAVLSELRVRPEDTRIDIVAPELPRIVAGIPLALRSLEMTIDRDGFMTNATGCAERQIRAVFGGSGGEQVESVVPYRAEGCERLPFAPQVGLKLDLSGRGPGVKSILALPPGHANPRRVAVSLPDGVAPNFDAVQAACPEADFAAGRCADSSIVGSARVETLLLPLPLEGPVRVVQRQGQSLPGLVIALSGVLPLTVRGEVSIDVTRLRTTFDNLPDVPLRRFELDFESGPGSAVNLSRELCRRGPRSRWVMEAHSGATFTAEPAAVVRGCKRRPRASGRLFVRGRRAALRLKVVGEELRGLGVTLPRAFAIRRRALRRSLRVRIGEPLPKGTRIGAGARRLSVRLPAGEETDQLRLSLRSRALELARKLRRGQRVTLALSVTAAGEKHRLKLRLRVR